MVGRALERDVERDLDAALFRRADEGVKVIESAELRVNRLVPALLGADRPRAARIPGLRGDRIVFPFARGGKS